MAIYGYARVSTEGQCLDMENILELLLIFMEEFISLWQRFWRKSWKNLILCL